MEENKVFVVLDSRDGNKIDTYYANGFIQDDELAMFRKNGGAFKRIPFRINDSFYTYRHSSIAETENLSFFIKNPWLESTFSKGEDKNAIIIYDIHVPIAYVVYCRNYDEHEMLTDIELIQCNVDKDRRDKEEIIRFALANLFFPFDDRCSYSTAAISLKEDYLVNVLREEGFDYHIKQYVVLKNKVTSTKIVKLIS